MVISQSASCTKIELAQWKKKVKTRKPWDQTGQNQSHKKYTKIYLKCI